MMKLCKSVYFFFEKHIDLFLFLFSIAVILLNLSLIFDDVLWGDEAFSANTVWNVGPAGVIQRVFYLDSHPPFYYLYLLLWGFISGFKTWAYHLASVLPFAGGIILAVTFFRKRFGAISCAFFVIVSGLSATCCEYNLEVRMYSLLFFELCCCIVTGYRIILCDKDKFTDWALLVTATVFAAYTHYYGLVSAGIFLFLVSLSYYLKKRGSTWKYGLFSILSCIILYSPWLYAFVRRLKIVSSNWWMEEPEKLRNVINFIFGGYKMKAVLFPLFIVMVILVFCFDTGLLEFRKEKELSLVFHKKPNFKKASPQFICIGLCLATIICVLGFAYLASALYTPILANRYTYCTVPFLLVILVAASSRLIEYGKEKDVQFFKFAILLSLLIILFIGLFDFKYFRSLTKVQSANTDYIMDIIGEPGPEDEFTATGVQHLSWTVLQHYFPNNTVYGYTPADMTTTPDTLWAFTGGALSEEELALMESRGYTYTFYPDLWLSKYECALYKFEK